MDFAHGRRQVEIDERVEVVVRLVVQLRRRVPPLIDGRAGVELRTPSLASEPTASERSVAGIVLGRTSCPRAHPPKPRLR